MDRNQGIHRLLLTPAQANGADEDSKQFVSALCLLQSSREARTPWAPKRDLTLRALPLRHGRAGLHRNLCAFLRITPSFPDFSAVSPTGIGHASAMVVAAPHAFS